MKKLILITSLVIASQILSAQSYKTSTSDMKEVNSKIEVLGNKNEQNSIITVLVDKNWNGIGMLMGKNATFTMNWQNVLNNQFIKLEFESKRKTGDSKAIIFKATAFYRIVNDTTVIGNWFDSRGVSFPLKGSVKANELIIFWGSEETEMGKTIYSNSNNNEITVEDFIKIKGTYTKFGYAIYKAKD